MRHKIYIETPPRLCTVYSAVDLSKPTMHLNRVEYEIDDKTLCVYKDGFMLRDCDRETANNVREIYKHVRF